MAAQLFIGESHVQQAALFGMDESGLILQPDCLSAPLKNVEDLLQANTGVSFIGEKRPRPTGDQRHNRRPNGFVKEAGYSPTIACLTCLKARDDDCKVCKVCCACCTCVPRKEFAKCAHLYAAAPAEDKPVAPLVVSLTAAAGELPSFPAVEQPVASLVNSVGVIESMVGNVPVTYADEEDYYDAPESLEGKDWVRESHCVGCDGEFTSRQAVDAHCCLEDGYAADDSSEQSDTYPTVEAVAPPKPVPLATDNAMSSGVIATPAASIHKW